MNKDLNIKIVDNVPPESIAMVQAKYSRSPDSADNHLKEVEERGPEKFMSSYYVGYGHKSIGDCGSISLFFEGISMLAAKAIQDTPLYSGQEASTRYMDMSKQAIIGVFGVVAPVHMGIQAVQMRFYQEILADIKEYLRGLYPRKDGESEEIYTKAINAKSFDIARGFLPAGVTTNVSWHTNLRQAYDHLKELKYHPLKEVSEIAKLTLQKLKEKYPSSFSHKEYEKDEAYVNAAMNVCTYYDSPGFMSDGKRYFTMGDRSGNTLLSASSDMNSIMLEHYKQVYINRPAKSELPKQLRACGTFNFQFQLDFGSFRDFQRHRSVVQPMPLLTTKFGFERWYIDQLPPHLTSKVMKHLSDTWSQTKLLGIPEVDQQYYIPMGYKVMCHVDAPFSAAVYLAELRSGQTVHPTLRAIANMWGAAIKSAVPDIELHCDNTPDEWSTKRGTQDIVKK